MLYYSGIEVSEGIDMKRQMHLKSVYFFLIKGLSFNYLFVMDVMMY